MGINPHTYVCYKKYFTLKRKKDRTNCYGAKVRPHMIEHDIRRTITDKTSCRGRRVGGARGASQPDVVCYRRRSAVEVGVVVACGMIVSPGYSIPGSARNIIARLSNSAEEKKRLLGPPMSTLHDPMTPSPEWCSRPSICPSSCNVVASSTQEISWYTM